MANIGFGRRLITGALLFVLLSEWMRPLALMSEVTGIFMLGPVLLTLAALLATDVLRLPAVLSWTIKTWIVLSLPAMVYGRAGFLNAGWWGGLIGKFKQDASYMLRMEWGFVSAELRTILFLMAWAVVASCLFTAVSYRRFALWFTAGTAAYLLVLSLWPGLDTFPGLLRATGAGLLLHAFHVPDNLLSKYGLRPRLAGMRAVWPLSIVMAASLALGAGYWMSAKFGDTSPIREVPAWESLGGQFAKLGKGGEWFGQAAVGRTGYGSDDSKLGGSIRPDLSPAFLAVTAQANRYFRGETKTIYDGKGWQERKNDEYRYEIGRNLPNVMEGSSGAAGRNEAAETEIVYLMDDEWLARLNADGLTDKMNRKASGLAGKKGRSPLFASGAIVRVEAARTAAMLPMEEGEAAVDRLEGIYRLTGLKQPLSSYRMLVHQGQRSNGSVLGESEAAATLQLPDDLPQRVRKLAEQIAAPHDSVLGKAKAIERFLKENYTYTLKPPKAKGKGDFVDRFLFEQRAGYCDYFSTAMAVMLRANGIPARWVKGFAPGEPFEPAQHALVAERMSVIEQGDMPEGMHYTLVRSSNAHSWVEAFIPGQGWTAFEPTPGIGEGEAASDGSDAALELAAVPALAKLETLSESTDGWLEAIRKQADHLTASSLRWALIIALLLGLLSLAVWFILYSGVIGLYLQLVAYAFGVGGPGADIRLLERLLTAELYGKNGLSPGVTMREAARRWTGTAHDLPAAIALYERLRFGERSPKRLSTRKLLAAWKSVKEWRSAVRGK